MTSRMEAWLEHVPSSWDISIGEYLSLSVEHRDTGKIPLFGWDNYLSIYLELFGQNLSSRNFATHEVGDKPKLLIWKHDLWDVPQNLDHWLNSRAAPWIMNIDIDVVNEAGSVTSIEAGTLRLTRLLDQQDDAVLQGTGTLDIASSTGVTMNGDINPGIPGTAGGTLSITGNLTLGSAAEVNIEVSSPTVYDVLAISGVATLGGTLLMEGTYTLGPVETLSLTLITYGSNPGPSTLASVLTTLANGSISPPPTYGSTSVTAFVLGL